jgi:hypothetical protein
VAGLLKTLGEKSTWMQDNCIIQPETSLQNTSANADSKLDNVPPKFVGDIGAEKLMRRVQSLRFREPSQSPALESFFCPITQEIMVDPVSTVGGQTYERAAIEQWLASGDATNFPAGAQLPQRPVLDDTGATLAPTALAPVTTASVVLAPVHPLDDATYPTDNATVAAAEAAASEKRVRESFANCDFETGQ